MKQAGADIGFLLRLVFDRDGVTAMEYGLLTGLIALVIVAAITLLSGNADTLFTHIANTI